MEKTSCVEFSAQTAPRTWQPSSAPQQEEFPLPTLGPLLELLHRDVLFGRGLQLLRGLPTQQEHGLK